MGAKMFGSTPTFCEILLDIFLPPLGVYLAGYRFQMEFWVCLVMTLFGFIPGILYALYVDLRNPSPQQPLVEGSDSPPSTYV